MCRLGEVVDKELDVTIEERESEHFTMGLQWCLYHVVSGVWTQATTQGATSIVVR